MPQIAGMPSARARIAAWLVALPPIVQMPSTLLRSIPAVTDAVGNRRDRLLGDRDRGRLDAHQQREHALPDVADVVGPFAQQTACERREPRRVGRAGLAPRVAGALATGEARDRAVDQLRVGQELEVRIENLPLRLKAEPGLEREHFPTRFGKGRIEPAALVLRAGAALFDRDELAAQLDDGPDRKTR
jgi:hypothetical protein